MRLPIYQVDAFADRVFAGNPAAVVPLDVWLADETLQAIAAENNLAETAYFVPTADGFDLRWFTPTVEIPLCGHATLASAFVLMTILEPQRRDVRFGSQSGPLSVVRKGDLFELDLPARTLEAAPDAAAIAAALGGTPAGVWRSANFNMALYESAGEIEALKPDLRRLAATELGCSIVTAPGEAGADFVSRFFGPGVGIDEDPVTGSAHCTLVPYWAKRLGKTKLVARQISARGGTLYCEDAGARTRMAGEGKLYLEGFIHI